MMESRYPIAYQLYSSRNFPPLEAQLPHLKAMGYDAIEPWLPAYEDNPARFRKALDDNGLDCYGFHLPLTGLIDETQRYVDIAQTLGARYLIPPFVSAEDRVNTPDFWRSIGEKLAIAAEIVAERELKVLWHNHDFEYVALPDGTRPIDHILSAPNVYFEIDCGWIVRAGADPGTELARFKDRILAIQTKDTAPNGTLIDDGWTATGDGIIDWASLSTLFRETKADHIVAEHDNPSDWKKFAKNSIDHLRSLGL